MWHRLGAAHFQRLLKGQGTGGNWWDFSSPFLSSWMWVSHRNGLESFCSSSSCAFTLSLAHPAQQSCFVPLPQKGVQWPFFHQLPHPVSHLQFGELLREMFDTGSSQRVWKQLLTTEIALVPRQLHSCQPGPAWLWCTAVMQMGTAPFKATTVWSFFIDKCNMLFHFNLLNLCGLTNALNPLGPSWDWIYSIKSVTNLIHNGEN